MLLNFISGAQKQNGINVHLGIQNVPPVYMTPRMLVKLFFFFFFLGVCNDAHLHTFMPQVKSIMLMLPSCFHLLPSCFHHASIMLPSCFQCFHHASVKLPSCFHHASIMLVMLPSCVCPSCFVMLPSWSCHHASIMLRSCFHHAAI